MEVPGGTEGQGDSRQPVHRRPTWRWRHSRNLQGALRLHRTNPFASLVFRGEGAASRDPGHPGKAPGFARRPGGHPPVAAFRGTATPRLRLCGSPTPSRGGAAHRRSGSASVFRMQDLLRTPPARSASHEWDEKRRLRLHVRARPSPSEVASPHRGIFRGIPGKVAGHAAETARTELPSIGARCEPGKPAN